MKLSVELADCALQKSRHSLVTFWVNCFCCSVKWNVGRLLSMFLRLSWRLSTLFWADVTAACAESARLCAAMTLELASLRAADADAASEAALELPLLASLWADLALDNDAAALEAVVFASETAFCAWVSPLLSSTSWAAWTLEFALWTFLFCSSTAELAALNEFWADVTFSCALLTLSLALLIEFLSWLIVELVTFEPLITDCKLSTLFFAVWVFCLAASNAREASL